MKFDCPHCGKSLKARQPEARDIFGKSKGFDCPHCRNPVRFRLHREEIGATALLFLSIVLPVQYFAERLKDIPFWVLIAGFALELTLVMLVLAYLVRNKNRYEKSRSNI